MGKHLKLDQRIQVLERLKGVLVQWNDTHIYVEGWNDKRLAEELGVNWTQVRSIRYEVFGRPQRPSYRKDGEQGRKPRAYRSQGRRIETLERRLDEIEAKLEGMRQTEELSRPTMQ
jgi:hypothetical protein